MQFDGAPIGYGPAPGVQPVTDAWATDTFSLFAEHQWHVNEKWTTFASVRGDKHTYTAWLFSPRLALAFVPNSKEAFKFIAARAVRRNGDGELRQEYVQTGTNKTTTETLDSLELRYDRQHDDVWYFGCGLFVEQNNAIGFDAAANHSVAVGTFKIWGIEPEATYHTKKTKMTLSHGYTKLYEADLDNSSTIQGITAEPYGYGHDLANWANHITKFALIHEMNTNWSASTSLRTYWGFPGARELAKWNRDRSTQLSYGLTDAGYGDAYGPSVYWNAGLEYRRAKNLTVRADAFNMMGWFDQTLNKRGYYFRGSAYSVEAPSVALSARVMF